MDRIISIKPVQSNKTIELLVGTDSSIYINDYITVYIDEYDNACNINSDIDSDHDIVVAKDAITVEAIPVTSDNLYNFNYKVTLRNDNLYDIFTGTMKHFTLNCNTTNLVKQKIYGIYYDPNLLYDYELKKLKSYCSSCLDDCQLQTVMLITFKLQLMEQAIETVNNEDAIAAYTDLMRILDVPSSEKSNCLYYNNCSQCTLVKCDKYGCQRN